MEQIQVIDWVDGTKFEGYLLVRTSEQRTTQAGLNFLNLTLADKTAEINAKVWDINATPPDVASIIKVRGTVINYNGRLQLKIEKFRTTTSVDNIDMSNFAPSAPRPADDMIKDIYNVIENFKSNYLKEIVLELINNSMEKLLYYPAAQKIHHAERSGLLHHITDMLKLANAIEPVYLNLDWDLVKAGIIIHDLSKLDELDSNSLGIVKDYTKDGLLIGHLVMGVSKIEIAANKLNTPKEISLLLQHMMISHHGDPEFGSPRRPMFIEAEMLHMIDTLDARMNQMQGDLEKLPQGSFSEKIWSLDRRLYNPNYDEIYNSET